MKSGDAADDDGTWTSETLPMSLRRQLLERELKQLGLRKPAPASGEHDEGKVQPPPREGSEHPSADEPADAPSGGSQAPQRTTAI